MSPNHTGANFHQSRRPTTYTYPATQQPPGSYCQPPLVTRVPTRQKQYPSSRNNTQPWTPITQTNHVHPSGNTTATWQLLPTTIGHPTTNPATQQPPGSHCQPPTVTRVPTRQKQYPSSRNNTQPGTPITQTNHVHPSGNTRSIPPGIRSRS